MDLDDNVNFSSDRDQDLSDSDNNLSRPEAASKGVSVTPDFTPGDRRKASIETVFNGFRCFPKNISPYLSGHGSDHRMRAGQTPRSVGVCTPSGDQSAEFRVDNLWREFSALRR